MALPSGLDSEVTLPMGSSTTVVSPTVPAVDAVEGNKNHHPVCWALLPFDRTRPVIQPGFKMGIVPGPEPPEIVPNGVIG